MHVLIFMAANDRKKNNISKMKARNYLSHIMTSIFAFPVVLVYLNKVQLL